MQGMRRTLGNYRGKSLPVLTAAQLTGRDDSHLTETAGGYLLQPDAAAAFAALQSDAAEAGFRLAIASAFRSFERQCAIFNSKALGQRTVHDDAGNTLDLSVLTPEARLHAILRFSALPGTSRHHWGTDLDVFDAAAVSEDYAVQLTPAEVAPGGPFDALHCWLDERMAVGASHGFYRPYAADRGGVAPERWHLSYAPVAVACGASLSIELVREALAQVDHALGEVVIQELPEQMARYVEVPEGWCPRL